MTLALTLTLTSQVCIIGGYGGPGTTRDFYMDVHMLELDTWSWVRVSDVCLSPASPASHRSACALQHSPLIVSFPSGVMSSPPP